MITTMKKKIYIAPCTNVVNISTERLVALSLEKGEGNFNPENMTFTKDSGDWDIWGNGSSDDYEYDDEY